MRSISDILQHYSKAFRGGTELAPADHESFFDAMIAETDEQILSDILLAWVEKGHTANELAGLAAVMRSRMKKISPIDPATVDIVGTGGSKAKTFNVSTAAAFVIAGAGVSVAKHGNRAATSNSGSADVLSKLGININVSPDTAEKCLKDIGICFMFAPRFHSLSPTLAKARRSLGQPTIFNNLGPLCNPASAPHQVIGVWNKDLVEKTANVLARIGTAKSWIVHNENGLDEIGLSGNTHVAEVSGNDINHFEITAKDFGVNQVSGDLLSGCSADESSSLIQEILGNQREQHDAEKLVLINAAAAIYIAGNAATLPEAFELAENSIRSGQALEKLNKLVAETTK